MSNRKPICTMFLLAAALQQWKIEDYNSERGHERKEEKQVKGK